MPRPRRHDDSLRGRLLEVTSAVVSERGTSAVTVRDVGRRAGTSSSAVYALFGNRQALLDAVVEEGFRRLGERLAATPTTADPGADLLALGLAYRDWALSEPDFYRSMFVADRAADADPRGDAAEATSTGRPTFRVLADAVRRASAVRRSGATPGDDDRSRAADEIALLLWGLVHGLVALELAGLLPGSPADRTARYERALRTVGSAALR